MTNFEQTLRPVRRRWRAATIAVTALVLLGCDSVLDADLPGVVTPGSLTGPAALTALYVGAIGDFNIGYSGAAGGGNFIASAISTSATLSDEVGNTSSGIDRQDIDRRQIASQNSDVTEAYQFLQRGRAAVVNAGSQLDQAATTAGQPDGRVGEMLSLEGFLYIALAEDFCSGVPISALDQAGTIQFGVPLTRDQLLDTAVVRFDAALAKAGGDVNTEALARVGKARAQLNLDDAAGAAATAARVPAGFVYQIFNSATASAPNVLDLANGFFTANNSSEDISVSDVEGGNGEPFRTAADPRVPVTQSSTNPAVFLLGAYAITGTPLADDAPVPLASAVEARLIEAEAQLRAGAFDAPGTGTLAILNDLRANFVGGPLPPLVDPLVQTAREDLVFQERAFWLYATGHRLGDLRRLVRQYGRTTETVFPTGAYTGGANTYGTDVNLPVPSTELNNPNFKGCIDRNA